MSQPVNKPEKTSAEEFEEYLNRPKKYIKVKVKQNMRVDQIAEWVKMIADRVYAEMPPLEFGDIDISVSLDFSGQPKIDRKMRKLIMDELWEELLR